MSLNKTEWSDFTLDKARDLLDDDAVSEDDKWPGMYLVQSSKEYRVQFIDLEMEDGTVLQGVTCTCPHGLRQGSAARCSHAAAVLMHCKLY